MCILIYTGHRDIHQFCARQVLLFQISGQKLLRLRYTLIDVLLQYDFLSGSTSDVR